ncbi:MAG: hypothetical protein C0464_03590 [Cyanobacteria bacterium DS2.008]|uniref:lipopolysaccharide biosynthesis protein n=1 Tax=Blastomonas sp. TaxID=1909299 RepID=UPI0017E4C709|nr:hypothetical protein [Cyanobacteria bacterium DS2.008]MBA4781361.1 hypothetical protein [Blastomonas sp.]
MPKEMSIAKGFVALSIAQAVLYTSPLALLWLLGRHYSDGDIGKFLLIQSLGALGSIGIEFGLSLPAIRYLNSNIEDFNNIDIRRYVNDIHIAKAIMSFFVFPALAVAIFYIISTDEIEWLFGAFLVAVGVGYRPMWLSQAFQKYYLLVQAECGSSIVAFFGVWIAINFECRASLLLIIWTLPKIIAYGMIMSRFGVGLLPSSISFSRSVLLLRSNVWFFISRSATSFSNLAMPAALFGVYGLQITTNYQKAERIFTAIQNFNFIASQVIFPKVASRPEGELQRNGVQDHSLLSNLSISVRLSLLQIGMAVILAIGLYVTAGPVIHFMWGEADQSAVVANLRVLAVIMVVSVINTAACLNFLIPAKLDAVAIGATIVGAVATFGCIYVQPSIFHGFEGAGAILIGELAALVIVLFGFLILFKVGTYRFWNGLK